MLNLKAVVSRILNGYALPWHGLHGPAHWARVLENGARLAHVTEADFGVVQLFAVFHDARRKNEGVDDGHGRRGAELAAKLRGDIFDLPNDGFTLLHTACVGHTDGLTNGDVTIQTCWDADRLDLGRVGIVPEPKRLCTYAAKEPAILKWADGRAAFRIVPEIVSKDWGLDVKGWD
jgi:uncharacterized protein